jgi:transcriptional regulator with AAA-type ATPase domain
MGINVDRNAIRSVATLALTENFQPELTRMLFEKGFVEVLHPRTLNTTLIQELLSELHDSPLHLPIPPMIVGRSMQRIYRRLYSLIHSEVRAIHVLGETGTGKELIAELVRFIEPRRPTVVINCASLPSSLVESELFGSVRGAFTGATHDKKGYIESAHEGWLVLDEVNSLSLEAQGALLRAIENQEFMRIGDRNLRKVSFRIISLSNQDTDQLVMQNRMRQDFQQRICEAVIHIPPLRERIDEIPDLVLFFLKQMRPSVQVAYETIEILKSYSFARGNVRELRNTLRASTAILQGNLLTPRMLPLEFWKYLREEKSQIRNETEPFAPKLEQFHEPRKACPLISQRKISELHHFWMGLGQFTHSQRLPMSVKDIGTFFKISESSVSRRLRQIVRYQVASLEDVARIVRLRSTHTLSPMPAALREVQEFPSSTGRDRAATLQLIQP